MGAELSFGEWLEDQYLRRGFTQGEFAEEIGVAQSTVSSWLNTEKRPRRRTIPRIAKVLELGQDEVLARAGYRHLNEPETNVLSPGEIDFDDPFLMFWASYSGDIDPHDKEILQELAKSLMRKKGVDVGDRGGLGGPSGKDTVGEGVSLD